MHGKKSPKTFDDFCHWLVFNFVMSAFKFVQEASNAPTCNTSQSVCSKPHLLVQLKEFSTIFKNPFNPICAENGQRTIHTDNCAVR